MKIIDNLIVSTVYSTLSLCIVYGGIFSVHTALCQTLSKVPTTSDTSKTAGSGHPETPDSIQTAVPNTAIRPDTLFLKTAPDSLKNTLVSGQPSPSTFATADTSYRFWNFPYWGFGAGWGLGSFPIFTEWIKGLPDSARDIAGPDTALKNFSVKEPADAYTIIVPLSLYWTPFADERQSLTFDGSFFWISKSFQAYLQSSDAAAAAWIHWQQSMATYSFSLGLTYKYNLSEQYFKVENVNRTSLVVGFSADPLLLVDKNASFSSSGLADSTMAKARTVLDKRSFHGIGCAWRVGFSSLKRLSVAKGIEIGLAYTGRWYGYFKNGKTTATWKDMNPAASSPLENVSFVANTFQITFALVSGRKPDR